MLGDFEMIVHHFERQDIKIYPIFDVHLGAQEHMTREWELFCQRILQDPCAYLVLGGDLLDNGTRNGVTNIFRATMSPSSQKKVMTKMLEPLRDRVLCGVPGNHERRSGKDADDCPTYDIMAKLDLEHLYRESMAFMKLQFGDSRGDGRANPAYSALVAHGAGGGALTGGGLNRLERWAYCFDGVDIVFTGHTHKPLTTQPGKIKVDMHNNKVSVVPFKVVTATSWLEYGGYAAQKMMTPSSFAPQIAHFCGTKKLIRVEM